MGMSCCFPEKSDLRAEKLHPPHILTITFTDLDIISTQTQAPV